MMETVYAVIEFAQSIPHLDVMIVTTAMLSGLYYVIKNDNEI